MRSSNLLLTLFSSVFAAFLLVLGIFSLLLPWSGRFQAALIYFITSESLAISLIGAVLCIMGGVLIYGLLIGQRRQYYEVTANIAVDEAVIQQYMEHYWQKAFPGKHVPSKVQIERNAITIMADLPEVPFDEQRELLQRIEEDLKDLLANTLNYQKRFTLSLSFPR